nr:hypothetical protein CJLB15_00043 [Campylobacter phage CJLB-15]
MIIFSNPSFNNKSNNFMRSKLKYFIFISDLTGTVRCHKSCLIGVYLKTVLTGS